MPTTRRETLDALTEAVEAIEGKPYRGAVPTWTSGNGEAPEEAVRTTGTLVAPSMRLSRQAPPVRVAARVSVPEESTDARVVRTGWPAVDDAIGGVLRGAVHEWLGVGVTQDPRRSVRGRDRAIWSPPLTILMHLARAAARNRVQPHVGHHPHSSKPHSSKPAKRSPQRDAMIVWIGSRVWPHVRLSGALGAWLARHSVFIDPPDDASRWWAIDLALRSPVFAAVVADGSGARMAQTRRLQLAAARSGGLGLLARPEDERRELSAASTRWVVTRDGGRAEAGAGERVTPGGGVDEDGRTDAAAGPRWHIGLARCRGRWKSTHGRHEECVLVEYDRDEGVVRVPGRMGDRPAAAPVGSSVAEAGPAARGARLRRPA